MNERKSLTYPPGARNSPRASFPAYFSVLFFFYSFFVFFSPSFCQAANFRTWPSWEIIGSGRTKDAREYLREQVRKGEGKSLGNQFEIESWKEKCIKTLANVCGDRYQRLPPVRLELMKWKVYRDLRLDVCESRKFWNGDLLKECRGCFYANSSLCEYNWKGRFVSSIKCCNEYIVTRIFEVFLYTRLESVCGCLKINDCWCNVLRQVDDTSVDTWDDLVLSKWFLIGKKNISYKCTRGHR